MENETIETVENQEYMENQTPETEAVETPEESPKPSGRTFTQEEVNDIIARRVGRTEAKVRREYDQRYGGLLNVLKAGTGKEDVGELTDTFKEFYGKNGVTIPQTAPSLSAREEAILGRAEAEDIIDGGYEEVIDEMKRLSGIGVEGMSEREKVVFSALNAYRLNEDRSRELAQMGVSNDVISSRDFKDFVSQFTPETPIANVYKLYQGNAPKKEIKPMGSMKSTPAADSGVKDFYSYEEASKFTVDDFNKNPALYRAVEKSMQKW